MVWKKVVKVVAVSACPKCGNNGFDPEPGTDLDHLDDPQAKVKCAVCGHTCTANEFMRRVGGEERTKP
jgi:predicted nucleic-acid-binding Zn-ribbon protein